MIVWLQRRIRDRDDRGAIAVMVALMATMLCVCGALAVDLGNLSSQHNQAQTAVDDAALSAAYSVGSNGGISAANATTAFNAAVQEMNTTLGYSPSASAWNTCGSPPFPSGNYSYASNENCVAFSGNDVWVSLPTQTFTTTLGKAAKVTGFGITASSTASYSAATAGTMPCALCLLDPNGNSSAGGYDAEVTGSSQISVTSTDTSSGVWINGGSTSSAAYISGTSEICTAHASTAQSCPMQCPPNSATRPPINVVTTATNDGTSSDCYWPTVTSQPKAVADPLASLPTPVAASIPSGTYNSSGNGGTLPAGTYGSVSQTQYGSLTIQPGYYSNITVNGSATLILQAGLYVIDGSFNVSGAASLNASAGVTLFVPCGSSAATAACNSSGQNGGSFSLSGSGSMAISPQTSGSYANLALYYDRNNTSTISASGATNLTGTIYAASALLTVSGSSTSFASLIVVGSALATGNTSISVLYTSTQNVAPPAGTRATAGLCNFSTTPALNTC